jgi:2-methylcitrate synthase
MSEEIKKGLLGIVVDETTISHVVPELSALTYRGYTVQELCDKCDFEEVAYLVLFGELPNKSQLKKGKKIISPDKKLSFSENFFKMMFNKVPDKEIVRAFDISLILYAEHSFNVSTFTARTITSSLSDIHGAITGAIASLKGPLHGGANEAVMHMMKEIGKPEKAQAWINNALVKKKVIMGFGHRVYRTGDSRVPTMKHYLFKVARLLKKEKYTKIYEILAKTMVEKKKIHPNVDFPCGPLYYMMGIDIDFYTPIFVMSRITGWSAHIMEQHASNKLIRPLSKYRGEEVREVMLLNQR